MHCLPLPLCCGSHSCGGRPCSLLSSDPARPCKSGNTEHKMAFCFASSFLLPGDESFMEDNHFLTLPSVVSGMSGTPHHWELIYWQFVKNIQPSLLLVLLRILHQVTHLPWQPSNSRRRCWKGWEGHTHQKGNHTFAMLKNNLGSEISEQERTINLVATSSKLWCKISAKTKQKLDIIHNKNLKFK